VDFFDDEAEQGLFLVGIEGVDHVQDARVAKSRTRRRS
jgi:hypothetical protein